jgi:hypothetical protein
MNTLPQRLLPCLAFLLAASVNSSAQALIAGRLTGDRWTGSTESFAYGGILGFDSLNGTGHDSVGFRTWETDPAGWFRFSTDAGNHTLVFTSPNQFMRPIVLNNIFVRAGEKLDQFRFAPRFDFTNLFEGAWDEKPASDYFQTFVAQGKSVTSVGFRLANDGVDGAGPGAQNFLVSIHRHASGTPDTWPQVGRSALVPDVDAGGPKNYLWSAAWNSGEIPLKAGETYVVHLRAEKPGATFQTFWRKSRSTHCYRIGPDGRSSQDCALWMAVGTDSDGLLIPYNKGVQKPFGEFAGFAPKWAQTYRAQGRSLAGVVLYAAVGGAQPPLARQRVMVRIRQGGADGPVCGLEKTAIGNGNYTGDASWGAFGVGFAPGEVPLVAGHTYAIEFESQENLHTLHGFVNIKGQVSDDRTGFNPYRKAAPDTYLHGAAYQNGRHRMPFDLDMQVIEYEFAANDPATATEGSNHLVNGDMEEISQTSSNAVNIEPPAPGQSGYRHTRTSEGAALAGWKTFTLEPQTRLAAMAGADDPINHVACVFANGGATADGGFVQRVKDLHATETYRLTGRVRSSWALDFDHQCMVGVDCTGQDKDPNAGSITWSCLPARQGVFLDFASPPIRPATNSISIWLRGRSSWKGEPYAPFLADFDDFALHRRRTQPPPSK